MTYSPTAKLQGAITGIILVIIGCLTIHPDKKADTPIESFTDWTTIDTNISIYTLQTNFSVSYYSFTLQKPIIELRWNAEDPDCPTDFRLFTILTPTITATNNGWEMTFK